MSGILHAQGRNRPTRWLQDDALRLWLDAGLAPDGTDISYGTSHDAALMDVLHHGRGYSYVSLDAGGTISCPDVFDGAAAGSVVKVEFVAKVADWTPGSNRTVFEIVGASDNAIRWQLAFDNRYYVWVSDDGTDFPFLQSQATIGSQLTNGEWCALRIILDCDTDTVSYQGATLSSPDDLWDDSITFFNIGGPRLWSELADGIFDSSADIVFGGGYAHAAIARARVLVDDVAICDFQARNSGQTGYTDATGAVWTISGSDSFVAKDWPAHWQMSGASHISVADHAELDTSSSEECTLVIIGASGSLTSHDTNPTLAEKREWGGDTNGWSLHDRSAGLRWYIETDSGAQSDIESSTLTREKVFMAGVRLERSGGNSVRIFIDRSLSSAVAVTNDDEALGGTTDLTIGARDSDGAGDMDRHWFGGIVAVIFFEEAIGATSTDAEFIFNRIADYYGVTA